MEREVVVVGAGPVGATAAIALAQRGHDVLLLDRQEFPRDKACGDGIPFGVAEILYDLGLKEKITQGGFYHVDKLRLVSPRGYVFDGELAPGKDGAKAHVIPRLEFDAMVQQHAIESGAEFCRAQVKAPLLEDGQVKGVRAQVNGSVKEIRARVVIGADGVTSAIARALQPNKPQDLHRAIALRAYIDDLELLPHQVEFYLYRDILPGYAWIFPLGNDSANIGLGMRLDKFKAKNYRLEEMMQVFMKLPDIKKRIKGEGKLRDIATWQLNFGSQKNIQRVFDGALLAGDAGSFIDPLTGGGIYAGLLSALLAAETISEALAKGDVSSRSLMRYEERCNEMIWPGMRRSYWIQRGLFVFPAITDWLIRLGRKNYGLIQTFMKKF